MSDIYFCVNKGKIKNLTFGKGYEVIRFHNGNHVATNIKFSYILIMNDAGIVRTYSTKRFKSIEDYRNDKIDSILINYV